MLIYEKLRRKPASFRSLTGLKVEEFDEIYSEIEPAYQLAEKKRLSKPDRKRAIGAGGKFKHDLRTRLLMGLIWLRQYPTYEVLGVLFDLHKSNICRNLKIMLKLLQEQTAMDVRWPDKRRPKKHLEDMLADFPSLEFIVDATEQPIYRPRGKEAQKPYYSGKKKRHTIKTQLAVTLTGEIGDISESVPGSKYDLTLLRESKLLEGLPEEMGGMGDKAYQGVQNDDPERPFYIPKKKPRGRPLPEEDKEANRLFAKVRIIVEHTLALLKRFQVLAQVYRHTRDLYNTIFRIVAGLVNRQIRRRFIKAQA